MRALDAWLNSIDISPPHFEDSKPHHAVRIAVMESRKTATISRASDHLRWLRDSTGCSSGMVVLTLLRDNDPCSPPHGGGPQTGAGATAAAPVRSVVADQYTVADQYQPWELKVSHAPHGVP
jgi:hypothetical protein